MGDLGIVADRFRGVARASGKEGSARHCDWRFYLVTLWF